MSKRTRYLVFCATWVLLAALSLAACAQSASITTMPAATLAPTSADPTATPKPACHVAERQSETAQTVLPLPDDKDWSQGPADAYVTIIEYSDFQ